MLIRTKDGKWYIYQLHGCAFVSWVSAKDWATAGFFPVDKAPRWVDILSEMTGQELEAVPIEEVS